MKKGILAVIEIGIIDYFSTENLFDLGLQSSSENPVGYEKSQIISEDYKVFVGDDEK